MYELAEVAKVYIHMKQFQHSFTKVRLKAAKSSFCQEYWKRTSSCLIIIYLFYCVFWCF